MILAAQVFYAVPDSETKSAWYYYTDPYPMEADPYITTDSWKTAGASSAAEAGEKIFTQYMEMYTGEDVPDYYRVKTGSKSAEDMPFYLGILRADFDNEYTGTADCKYMNEDGFYRLDVSKLNIEEGKGYEYCGYDHDIETGKSVVYGNVTGSGSHGVKFLLEEDEHNISRLVSVETTDEPFTPYEFCDSFDKINIPDNMTAAEEILEYMKKPRDGCDFTVMDYRSITEEADGTYAEVRFKGRLEGQYSSDLMNDGGDGYLKVRII